MPFIRPTLSDLVTQVQNDFTSRLSLQGTPLRRSMVAIVSRVLAGAAHMMYGLLQFLSLQLFADKSDGDYLVRQGSVLGVVPEPAAFASGTTTVTGTGTVTAGSLLRRSDGAEYSVNADTTITTTGTVAITAVVAAAAGDCDAGTILSFESPITGLNADTTVYSGGLTGGADAETTEAYRARVLERLQNPPQGGNETDYIAWAQLVPGVTRVWVYPLELGAGTVVVRFMRDNDTSPIPTSPEVAAVQASLQANRPVTATVTALAPVANPLNFTLHIVPDNSTTRAAVNAELADLISRTAEPAGATGTPSGTILLSSIRTAIGTAPGVSDYTLTAPSADVTNTTGQITTIGSVTWT